MEKKEEKVFLIYRESLLQSFLADTYSFTVLLGTFAVSHLWIESKALDIFVMILWFFWLFGKSSVSKRTFTNKKDAVRYIQNI